MTIIEREYAEALYQLAFDLGQVDEFLASLKEIRSLVLHEESYLSFLSSPAIAMSERLSAIEDAFASNYHEYIVSFLKLLCENGRIGIFPDCVDHFEQLVMYFSNRVNATVTSAVELSNEQLDMLVGKIRAIVGKEIDPICCIDPALIGGVKVEVDGKIYDGSLLRRLSNVKEVMSR